MRLYSHKNRAFHLSSLALEALPRIETDALREVNARQPEDCHAAEQGAISHAIPEYLELFRTYLDGAPAPSRAPVPDDVAARANNLKASAYFLDATIGGVCVLQDSDWLVAERPRHTHAFVYLIEFEREPAVGEPGDKWIRGSNAARGDLRATELAVILSGYLRAMGFAARGHAANTTLVDIEKLAVRAGVVRAQDGMLQAPYLKGGFRLGVVTTDYAMACDAPLAPEGVLEPSDPSIRMGMGGTRPEWWSDELAKRPLHLGRYPMEKIKRADEPTTLVLREEIRRVPKRGDFFKRAQAGDMGAKAQQEKSRFAMKHPYALGMAPLIQNMVPLQGTREPLQPTGIGGDLSDPQRNADAIKALGHFLGADFVGICIAEPWMYYSHDEVEGREIPAYHKYAVCMLIDQGFETMEGASGDDWISASQSMRAYLRGAEIAGVMAAHCRRMGYSARSHSNAHSEVIHNPTILMSGLGEVSRIGETILNPFIGPRSKSVVFTTDLPMTPDRPIAFNLQNFCDNCLKCARECPCNAITYGPKVMFNGYEIWKADVEKCTKYRVTQQKGSACGRCMKMCPWNREDTVEAERLTWLSIDHPELAKAIADLDDHQGNGARNPIKKWWFDLEMVNGVAMHPVAGINERDLSPDRGEKLAKAQKLAFFPPELQPRGGTTLNETVPVDREAGLAHYAEAETPAAARRRQARNSTESER
ncbi:4Fe-4S dicluster domain-containing protein [Noviherbaspirillum saxi]|uniref:Fe-S protein n=1 Tax=Noviherbaspirillum saxi TaxID=2320863 RepID=A0A3A3FL59_9BURK|nr:reductive dehalogenase domain-containing protein [Noviherbaspirillum saxi]RJF95195.1 Fe-S protein [Noviherbaspirillum saxi]